MSAERLLTPRQVAERLALSPVTIGHMLRKGALPGQKVQNRWRVAESALDAYITEGTAAHRAAKTEKKGTP